MTDPTDIADREERVEWRVETAQTEDDFGTDESSARQWFSECKQDLRWRPVALLRRTVVVETSAWEKAR